MINDSFSKFEQKILRILPVSIGSSGTSFSDSSTISSSSSGSPASSVSSSPSSSISSSSWGARSVVVVVVVVRFVGLAVGFFVAGFFVVWSAVRDFQNLYLHVLTFFKFVLYRDVSNEILCRFILM
jgi:hypothetical protein